MVIYTCPVCGADLYESVIATLPPIHVKECVECGWKHEEREEVIRRPYPSGFSLRPYCAGCPNNKPGVACCCTLGDAEIT